MKKALQNALFKKYPSLFRRRSLTANRTAMCRGIACGDGWYDILDTLSFQLQGYAVSPKGRNARRVAYEGLKEKFGVLNVWRTGGDAYTERLARRAEAASSRTCEQCGSRDRVARCTVNAWYQFLCLSCRRTCRARTVPSFPEV